jgi:DNA-directed RNA polymerase specialized sigma24 family protein
MFRFRRPEIAAFRADYAMCADFCAIFEEDMKPLYLLAFLLTADHKKAAQCFESTVEEAFKKQAVFKEWARTWVKRKLIENAIAMMSPVSARAGEKQELWEAWPHETGREGAIDAVTKLAPLERFVLVMSIFERHSNWDCALLLGCSMNKVAQARKKALRRLPALAAALFPRAETPSLHVLQVTAEHGPVAGQRVQA